MRRMFKKMLMKAAMSRQLKNMPKEAREQILALVDKHPEFFEKMAKEIQTRVKNGEDKMFAMQAVAKEYQAELQKLIRSE